MQEGRIHQLKSDEESDSDNSHSIPTGLKFWCFLAAVLGVLLILNALSNIWVHVQQVQNGYYLAHLHNEAERLINVERKLRLEWSRFQDPYHLEELGRKDFGLSPPRPEQKIMMK